MNKTLLLLLTVVTMASCRSGKKLPEGAPPRVKLAEVISGVEDRQLAFDQLQLRFNGNFSSEGSSQGFKLEVRLLRDSLIWVDLADPLLGIKVARAVIYPDSVAFINRLDQEYMQGNIETLQKEFKIDFGFDELQSLLSADLLFDPSEGFDLYYRPGAYVLSNFNLDEQDDPAQYSGVSIFRQAFLNPQTLKAEQQIQNEPALGKRYQLYYKDIAEREHGVLYPEKIILEFLNQSSGKLTLDLRSISLNDPQLNLPFNIPAGYAKMR